MTDSHCSICSRPARQTFTSPDGKQVIDLCKYHLDEYARFLTERE